VLGLGYIADDVTLEYNSRDLNRRYEREREREREREIERDR
jgi:hypothetical protein